MQPAKGVWGFAVLLAGSGGYDAASSNYGGLMKKALADLANTCPIVGSYGVLDKGLRNDPKRIADALDASGIAYDIKVYALDARIRIIEFFDTHTAS